VLGYILGDFFTNSSGHPADMRQLKEIECHSIQEQDIRQSDISAQDNRLRHLLSFPSSTLVSNSFGSFMLSPNHSLFNVG
jgi:hypothetical protein